MRRSWRRPATRGRLRAVAVVVAMVVTALAVSPPWAARAGTGLRGLSPGSVSAPPPVDVGPPPVDVGPPPVDVGPVPRPTSGPAPPSVGVGPLPAAPEPARGDTGGAPPPEGAALPAPPRPPGAALPAPPRPPGAGLRAPGAHYAWPLAPVPAVAQVFRKPTFRYGRGHRGADLTGTPGQAVLAAREGVVVFAGRVADRGVVSVDHPDGLRSTYEPVTASVTAGSTVAAGDPLGRLDAGHAGCPAMACLHWGVRRDRLDHLDPLALLRPPRMRLLPWDGAPP